MALSYSLSSLVCVAKPSRYSFRSSCDGTLLRFPPMKSSKTLGDRVFMFAAPKLWNSLPRDIRSKMNPSTFKMKLKTFLFSQVFSWLGSCFNLYTCIHLYLGLFLLFLELLWSAFISRFLILLAFIIIFIVFRASVKHNLYKCQLLLLLLLLLLLARNCFVSQNIVVSHETLSCFKQNCFVTEKISFCIGKFVVFST